VILRSFDAAAYEQAIDQLLRLEVDPKGLSEEARAFFDVTHGIEKYHSIYRRLKASVPRSQAAGAVRE